MLEVVNSTPAIIVSELDDFKKIASIGEPDAMDLTNRALLLKIRLKRPCSLA